MKILIELEPEDFQNLFSILNDYKVDIMQKAIFEKSEPRKQWYNKHADYVQTKIIDAITKNSIKQ